MFYNPAPLSIIYSDFEYIKFGIDLSPNPKPPHFQTRCHVLVNRVTANNNV